MIQSWRTSTQVYSEIIVDASPVDEILVQRYGDDATRDDDMKICEKYCNSKYVIK